MARSAEMTRRRGRVSAFLIFTTLALTSISARAESEASSQGAELFREAREAMKAGDYRGACAGFERSQRLEPAAGTLLNIAVCSEKLGRLQRARKALEDFFGEADQNDSRRSRAQALLADVKERTPRLRLKVSAPIPTGARVLIDGAEIAKSAWRVSLSLDPGQHVVELRAPGKPEQRRTIEIRERENLTETFVVPVSTEPDRARPPIRPRTTQRALPPTFYVSLGVGVGGLVTAAGTGLFVLRQHATVEEHCQDKRCDAEGLAAGEQGNRYRTVSSVAWPIGAAGMALAGYLWFTTQGQGSSPKVGVSIGPSQAVFRANF